MSWKSISGNQTISRANLQDAINNGVFVQKNSVPGTNTNKSITKSEIQNYIYTWDLYPPFRSKANNQLPVKSNMAIQSNQIYASASMLHLGNNNRAWTFPIFYDGADEIGSVSSSTDNRCILLGKSYVEGSYGGGAWVSNNGGESFTRLDSIMTTNDAATSTAMNSYGDYMIVTRQVGSFGSQRAYIYWSYNSGVNWATGYHDSVDYNFNGAAMSGVGVYATVLGSDGTSYYVWTSNSYGSSFTKTYLCNGSKTLITGCVGMSKSGQYQLLTPPEPTYPSVGYFYVSNNYGSSWTSISLAPIPLAPNDVFKGCSVSAGGDYMTVVAYSTTLNQFRTYISSDFGVNWTIVSGGSLAQSVDSSGQFQYQNGRQSIDYGYTWTTGFSSGTIKSISVNPTTYTTPHIYGASTGGTLYKSVNQGVSFTPLSLSGFVTNVATSGGSNNGKYVCAIVDNDPGGNIWYTVYQSNDYGATWYSSLSSGGQIMTCSAVSDDGIYWLAFSYDLINNVSNIYKSYDSGGTWDYIGDISGRVESCAMSNDGKYMTAIANYPNGNSYSAYVAKSSNYGVSWSSSLYSDLSLARTYVDVAMSGHGKFRAVVTNDPDGARLFYSSDYGVTWSINVYIPNYQSTSCALDDTGRVGLASFVANDGQNSYLTRTFDGFTNHTSFSTSGIYPGPLLPPHISGVNISSDATYWSAFTNNAGFSFSSSSGGSSYTNTSGLPTFNKISK